MERIDYLSKTRAKVKFLSLEPLIGELTNLNLRKIEWVMVGGESGHKRRPMGPDWVLDIHDNAIRHPDLEEDINEVMELYNKKK